MPVHQFSLLVQSAGTALLFVVFVLLYQKIRRRAFLDWIASWAFLLASLTSLFLLPFTRQGQVFFFFLHACVLAHALLLLRGVRRFRDERIRSRKLELLWVLPIVGLVMYVSLTVLERFPHIYNYPVAVTNENARELYTLGRRWLSVTKTILTASLGFAFYATVQTARGQLRGLSQWYLPVLLLTLSAVTGVVLVRMWRTRSS